jgi:hypothetical protein
VNWAEISAEGAWTTVHIGFPLSSGVSMLDLAKELGQSQKSLERRLEKLREEMIRAAI